MNERIEPPTLAEVRKVVPFDAVAVSDGLGWVGLEAARYQAAPPSEVQLPALPHHMLAVVPRPPEKPALSDEAVNRRTPLPFGSASVMPAGTPILWRWSGRKDSLHIHLDTNLVGRVAAEAFGLDPART